MDLVLTEKPVGLETSLLLLVLSRMLWYAQGRLLQIVEMNTCGLGTRQLSF